MKVNLKGLKELKNKIQTEFENQSGEKAKTVSKTVIAKLKENTPVDSGEARDGWSLIQEGKTFSIANEVEHISLLNEGHSMQAPSHFVEMTVLQVPNVKPNGVIIRSK